MIAVSRKTKDWSRIRNGRVALRSLDRRPIVIASHPRSGTHLTIDLFRNQFRECRSWKMLGEGLSRLYLSLESLYETTNGCPTSEEKALRLLRRARRPLIKTHQLLGDMDGASLTGNGRLGKHWIEWLRASADFCYVHRDVRDVMCSYHLFLKGTERRAHCSLGEFLRQKDDKGMTRVGFWTDHVRRWLNEPGVHAVRFTDIVTDPMSVLDRMASEIDLSPLARYPLVPRKMTSVWQGRLNRLISVRPESTAILGRPRGFSLDKWREVLTRADGQLIQREAGDLLIELGYETSADWISDLRRPERLVFLPPPRKRSKRRQPTLAAPPKLAATQAA